MVLGREVLAGRCSLRGARATAKPAADAGRTDEAIASHRTTGAAIPDDDADGTFTVDEYRICAHGRVTTSAFEAGDQDRPWSRPCSHGTG